MKPIRRDLFLILGLFALLAVYVILGPARASNETPSLRPTTHASSPGGALAMLRWAEYLGYGVERLEYQEFRVDPSAGALIILAPSRSFNRTQANTVLDWVAAGGMLILVEEQAGFATPTAELLRGLELTLHTATSNDGADTLGMIQQAPVIQPVFTDPPVQSVQVHTDVVITTDRTDVAPLVGTTNRPLIVGVPHGAGYVFVSSALYPFTNEGLRDAENAALVLNLLQRLPPNRRVLFDEFHHGFFEPPSLRSLLLTSAWGQALIYAICVGSLYLILTGRRFGRPIPLREEIVRRSSAEYVESMADLFQRGGQATYILRHYVATIRRRLIRPYGLPPDVDDTALSEAIANQGTADTPKLTNLLHRLRRTNARDIEILQLVNAADALLQEQHNK